MGDKLMNAEMEIKRTIINQNLDRIASAYAEIMKCGEELDAIGVNISGVNFYRSEDPNYSDCTIRLRSGINTVSVAKDTPIDSKSYNTFGQIALGKFIFSQFKIPVEYEERYA